MEPHILLVEDEEPLRITLAMLLEDAGCRVTALPDGESALALLPHKQFDVVLTDIQMRDVSGIDVLNAVRAYPNPSEVILLTGYGSMETAIAAVRAGAYDYLLKPCRPAQLVACVSGAVERRRSSLQQAAFLKLVADGLAQLQQPGGAALRQDSPPPQQSLPRSTRVGELVINHDSRSLSLRGQTMSLTPIEYALLRCLAEAEGRVCAYREIVQCTHGADVDDEEAQQLIKPHVLRLRRKIGQGFVVNVRGTGYRLIDPGVDGSIAQ